MKKFLITASLALGLAFTSQQEAKAWVNTKFSVGLNFHHQSGGNSFFWGLFNNGQPPSPFQFDQPPHGMPPGGPGFGPQNFQYFGQQQMPNTQPIPAPPPAPAAQQQQANVWNNNPYQPVSYHSGNYFAPSTGAYYPGYSGYFQPPAYWYSR